MSDQVGNPEARFSHVAAYTKSPYFWLIKITYFHSRGVQETFIPLIDRLGKECQPTCGTSQVLLAGVSGGFSPGTPVFAPPTD